MLLPASWKPQTMPMVAPPWWSQTNIQKNIGAGQTDHLHISPYFSIYSETRFVISLPEHIWTASTGCEASSTDSNSANPYNGSLKDVSIFVEHMITSPPTGCRIQIEHDFIIRFRQYFIKQVPEINLRFLGRNSQSINLKIRIPYSRYNPISVSASFSQSTKSFCTLGLNHKPISMPSFFPFFTIGANPRGYLTGSGFQ